MMFNMKKIIFLLASPFLLGACASGENSSKSDLPSAKNTTTTTTYWQQHVDYKMDVKMNVENYRYTGTQQLQYTNHSPDTLHHVFYHLYFNAFQPGSEMDVRARTISNADNRVVDNISKLAPAEIGYLNIKSLRQNGTPLTYHTEGTILEVALGKPVLPGETATFSMEFEGQVPVQIRRSGRNNKEGVALSMTQWYPKMAEFDIEGWHADPYIGREFHGVWGNFDVKITIDKNYILGGSGYLQNPQEIGYGYEEASKPVKRPEGSTLTWHFYAPQVHDFAWVADPEYLHDKVQVENGPVIHFLYKNKPSVINSWKKLQPKAVEMMEFFSRNIGPYPYKQYSILQGGDGGMEYAMCTLITGERSLSSLAGVTAHEMAHSWFQQVLATNESKHEWMDEGFTSFISDLCMNQVMNEQKENPFAGAYRGYRFLATSGNEQPQTTHADRYTYNRAYGISAYSKGEVFLAQLGYVIGTDNLMKTIRRYYDDFKFTHPTPNDIKRTAERVSGLQLDWYLTDWTQTTNTIDYAVKTVTEAGSVTEITLERIGLMPMPIDILVNYTDGSRETFYIPLSLMRGEKENPYPDLKRSILPDWGWGFPTYKFRINKPVSTISAVVIDPSELMADINLGNNIYMVE